MVGSGVLGPGPPQLKGVLHELHYIGRDGVDGLLGGRLVGPGRVPGPALVGQLTDVGDEAVYLSGPTKRVELEGTDGRVGSPALDTLTSEASWAITGTVSMPPSVALPRGAGRLAHLQGGGDQHVDRW